MSYILDALKKSERERPPGPVPDLFTVHGPQPAPPRRSARAIVAAALLLTVPAIALWVWVGMGRRAEDAARPPVAAAPAQRAAASDPPVTPRVSVVPKPPAPARAAAAGVARKPAGGRQRISTPATSKAPDTAASPVAGATIPPAQPLAEVRAVVPPAPPSPDAPAHVPLKPSPVVAGSPAGAEPARDAVSTAPAVEEAPPADGRVLDVAELPEPVRAGLPKLHVTGIVWSEEPSLRLLSVDDRILREGGEAAAGVSLREITPEGAEFVFKGWHFRVTGGRP
jgi:general secretion pathway protein B